MLVRFARPATRLGYTQPSVFDRSFRLQMKITLFFDPHTVADVFDLGFLQNREEIRLGNDLVVKLDAASPSHNLSPLGQSAINLALDISSGVGVGLASHWLWRKISARKTRVLVEREEVTVESEEELQRVIYERWRIGSSQSKEG